MTVAELHTPAGSARVPARKDSKGQEAIIKLDELRPRIENLMRLHTAVRDAAETYSDAVKAVAEKTGLHTITIRHFVSAKCSEDFEEHAEKVRQLAFVFDELAS